MLRLSGFELYSRRVPLMWDMEIQEYGLSHNSDWSLKSQLSLQLT